MNRNLQRTAEHTGDGSTTAGKRGVALVVTLIMLSVITVITITILAIARRDRAAVTQATNLTDARLAAEAALERAKGEIMAQILQNNALMGYDLTVSQAHPTNAWVDPSVPVFVDTNRGGFNGPLDDRRFLDLNRNGRFDPTVVVSNLPGDPHWIGLLEKPYRPHDGNNRFSARYAFLVVPIGKGLDVNWGHNEAIANPPAGYGFMRNQGYGPWEMNLAAFLADLAPSVWGGNLRYSFGPFPAPMAIGPAFADAAALLHYRQAGNPASFLSVFDQFGPAGRDAFESDLIDGYALGPAMGTHYPWWDSDDPAKPWPGSDSTRHFFNQQDFFDASKVSSNFVTNLKQAIANDPSVFYRMLAQLGTDSGAEDLAGKINLNYVVDTNTSPVIYATNVYATNFVPWTVDSSAFFLTNTAERLLRQQYMDFNPGLYMTNILGRLDLGGITNFPTMTFIQVAPTNSYTPSVHRLFQVAANIYDATQTNIYPSVFRPLFTTMGTNVFLSGFTNDSQYSTLPGWLASSRQYGIPLVIGAKKGFPNFNEFTLQTDVTVTRKLSFSRPNTNSPPNQTNQMYILGVSNLFAAEAWNSYETPYPRPLEIIVTDQATVMITNSQGVILNRTFPLVGASTNLGPNWWRGQQFLLPINQREVILSNSVYSVANRWFEPVMATNRFDPGFPTPEWYLTISNNFQYLLLEGDRILDFVISRDFNVELDIDQALMGTTSVLGANGVQESAIVARLWDTNRQTASIFAPTDGIRLQIAICLGMTTVGDDVWTSYLNDTMRGMDKPRAIAACQEFFQLGRTQYPNVPVAMNSLTMQSPFCPTRRMVRTATWQVDDPLVHTHVGDLLINPSGSNWINEFIVPPTAPVPTNMTLSSLGRVNPRYSPWGGPPGMQDPNNPPPGAYDMAVKDPGVRSSDDWDFPSSRFPSVGWLGRVHRGTPWQTINFKAKDPNQPDITFDDWTQRSAEYLWDRNRWYVAHPTNDWALADIFTTAVGPNWTHGRLSVNQPNLPAWSAVLGGVVLLRNTMTDEELLSVGLSASNSPIPLTEELVPPAANDTNPVPALFRLVAGINDHRSKQPNQTFTNLAQFLQTPELTVGSPWLNWQSSYQRQLGLTDTAYERIPQQILSLVQEGPKVLPRFVVYAYGQALKPAADSIDTSSRNICTNYQVTAEVSTRAVIRVEGGYELDHGTNKLSRLRTVIESFNILPPD